MPERPVGKRRAADGSGIDGDLPDDSIDTEISRGQDGDLSDEREAQEGPAPYPEHTGLPPRVESWRKRSATGAILTGFALGLQQVFEPERKEPAIVQETSGEPPTDLPVEAELEGVVGRRSVVRIRPWLLDEDGDGVEGDADADPSTTTTGVAPRARRRRRVRRRRR
jgi:hypothetical protein